MLLDFDGRRTVVVIRLRWQEGCGVGMEKQLQWSRPAHPTGATVGWPKPGLPPPIPPCHRRLMTFCAVCIIFWVGGQVSQPSSSSVMRQYELAAGTQPMHKRAHAPAQPRRHALTGTNACTHTPTHAPTHSPIHRTVAHAQARVHARPHAHMRTRTHASTHARQRRLNSKRSTAHSSGSHPTLSAPTTLMCVRACVRACPLARLRACVRTWKLPPLMYVRVCACTQALMRMGVAWCFSFVAGPAGPAGGRGVPGWMVR